MSDHGSKLQKVQQDIANLAKTTADSIEEVHKSTDNTIVMTDRKIAAFQKDLQKDQESRRKNCVTKFSVTPRGA